MRILHYTLGMSPYRSGGLTKYSEDLVKGQIDAGHDLNLLFPGKIGLIFKKTLIKKKNRAKKEMGVYELVNPLPVPLVFGIDKIEPYMLNVDKGVFTSFLDLLRPDIIHIHTIQGLYPSFFDAAKDLGIKIVFTTHDCYGVWPDLDSSDGITSEEANHYSLGDIHNHLELSLKKIVILQSNIYRLFKENTIIKKARKTFKKKTNEQIPIKSFRSNDLNKQKYKELSKYYKNNIFNKIDLFLYNSALTKSIFEKNKIVGNSRILNITYGQMNIDINMFKEKISSKLTLFFAGSENHSKGLPYLIELIDSLGVNSQKKIKLITVDLAIERDYTFRIPRYTYDELPGILREVDIIIVPSMYYETFGLGVLEALSNGKLTIVSGLVGAKEIVENLDCGFTFKNKGDLRKILEGLLVNNEMYNSKISKIKKNKIVYNTMSEHIEDVLDIYKHTK